MADDVAFVGKKIFFLNPTYSIKNVVIPAIFDKEYETYIIDNYHDAKAILRKNPESILFVNIDSQMTIFAWLSFLDSFKEEAALSKVCIGIFSDKISNEMKERFFEMIKPACGLLKTTLESTKLINSIVDVINMNGARGKRQFIRVMVVSDKNAELIVQWGSSMCRMKMLDISSVGTAVQIPYQYKLMFQEKTMIPNVILKLGTITHTVNIAIYQIIERNGASMAVTLFGNGTPLNVKNTIRTYIYDFLQNTMFTSINGEGPDETDYATLGKALEQELQNEAEVKKEEEKQIPPPRK